MTQKLTLMTLGVLSLALAAAPSASADKNDKHKHKHGHNHQRVEITVTEDGFVPADVSVKRGTKVVLAITRKTDKTCATKVIVQVSKGKKIEKELPLDETVEIPVTFRKSGKLTYACGMGHLSGVISIH